MSRPFAAIRFLPFLAPLALLAACGQPELETADRAAAEAGRAIAERLEAPPDRYSSIRVADRPYVGLTALPEDLQRRGLLPAEPVTLPLRGDETDGVLARRLEAALDGMRVSFAGPAPEGVPPALGVSRDALSPAGDLWTGPPADLLDAWTEARGYEWRHDPEAERVAVIRSRTAIFRINALAGSQSYEASSSTQDREGEDGAANLTRQQVAARAQYEPWKEIAGQLKALLDEGTRVSVAPSSASVAVRGLPREIARVRRFLAHLNREVLRPVSLTAHVYTVRYERSADYELGVLAALQRIGRGGAGGFNVEVGEGKVALVKPGRSAEDTLQATLRALSQAGNASRTLTADVPSLNGRPAQFFELFNESYLKEVRTTVTDGAAQTQLIPGTISSGFSLSYLPRITGPDEVLVRLFASLQDRPAFREFASASQRIQLPAYAARAVQVTQRVRRGETLVVTGFRDRAASSDRTGSFLATLPAPEGGREASLRRFEQVLLVSAEIGDPLGISEGEEL